MYQIRKYTFDLARADKVLELPLGSQFLDLEVITQGGGLPEKVLVWMQVPILNEDFLVPYNFIVRWTGEKFTDEYRGVYLKTVRTISNGLVWHFYLKQTEYLH